MRQVNLKLGGRLEKLLIVRDEGYKVHLEQLMETKEQMQDFTDLMVQQIDEYALSTFETLKDIEGYVIPEGRNLVDDCTFEMKKMRYRIRDYRDIYDIADDDFNEPNNKQIDLRTCMQEI